MDNYNTNIYLKGTLELSDCEPEGVRFNDFLGKTLRPGLFEPWLELSDCEPEGVRINDFLGETLRPGRFEPPTFSFGD